MALGAGEIGICEICKKHGPLRRTYFRYDIKCECHSPQHFEMVHHCKDCVPAEPEFTRIHIKTSLLKQLVNKGAGKEGE